MFELPPDEGEPSLVVIGGGPAGLTAAYEYQKLSPGSRALVFEGNDIVGGISRTESYKGFRFDIGGHRFFTKVPEVEAMWHEVLGDDLMIVPRSSRIYYRGRFFDYPLKLFNALTNIGAYEAIRIVLSYIKWQIRRDRADVSFEDWVINRFGGRLYMHFFKSYTEKVWGIDPKHIQADWAAQRIRNMSLFKAVWNAISGANDTASLIEEFLYPRLGPGQMWERTADLIEERGGEVRLRHWVRGILRDGTRVTGIEVQDAGGTRQTVPTHNVVNTMSLRDMVAAFDPPPPPEVVEAADRLKYRDFLIVTLVLDRPDPFPDNWIYVHSGDVKVGRIQNFRAWSPQMLPDDTKASIGMEYFCQEGDGLWTSADDDLHALATKELVALGLARDDDVIDGTVIRQPKAYPVYDTDYRAAVDTISAWVDTLENFQCVGRNGQHRYNNQDHSMLTAMLAARNILGATNDVWSVNVERSYHEEFELPKDQAGVAQKARA
ncbi:MAG: NAD(P)/FAD-dependent oxidoreductase [Pseudomonadota bacterium]